MSDNRKVLIAKRKNERGKIPSNRPESKKIDDEAVKRGLKRAISTPKKNLANDRLKRLRTSLNEEVQKPLKTTPSTGTLKVNNKSVVNVRKRPQGVPEQSVSSKLTKKDEFVFKEEFAVQKSVFTTVTQNPFLVGNSPQAQKQDTEAMEWSPTDDEISLNESATASRLDNKNVNTDPNSFFIVVDTNIFISKLQILKNIISMKISGAIKPIVFIPWIVTEELDFIKSDSNRTGLRFKAQEAIKFIENTFSSKSERIRGQTLLEANEQKSVGANQDNKIIACCLQILEKNKNMILLTNDINLKNKAHFNNIPVCSDTEIVQKILAHQRSKAEVILQKMTSLAVTVIYECAKNAYGDACKKMPICQSKPKSIQECISIFTKYWFPVFQELLMKQFKKSIDDLSTFLNKHQVIHDGSKELSELIRLCVRTCLFLKDVECCRNVIESTIRDLNDIKET